MKAVIQFTKPEEARALPILLRHSAGAILPNRTYVLGEEAVAELRKSGVRFVTLSYESRARVLKEWGPVKEYDIFLPLYYNDGSPVEPEKFQQLQETLLDHFGGLTFFPQPNKGFWRMAGVTYRDEIVIYRVIGTAGEQARPFLENLKAHLKADLEQEEILIVERDVEML